MRITSLQLENIKSYRYLSVPLTSGLNAICGLNGSGKTTILEAIGFTLFDYLPYGQKDFVREGEKSGTVRARIQAQDGREYEVVRRVGSGGAYYVSDVETNTRLAERGPNVLDWIRANALGIDGEADLEALFKNAVGVPQGTMTGDFLAGSVARKSIFDPLLRVEEYRSAYEYLRETISYLKDRTGQIKEEMARLETDAFRIPEVQAEVLRLQEALQGSEEELRALAARLEEVDVERSSLDALKELLAALRQSVEAKRKDIEYHEAMLGHHQEALEAARQAQALVEETREGYRLVTMAREELAALEGRRTERERLTSQVTEAKVATQSIWARIESLDADLRRAMEDAEAAARLGAEVERQTELEAQLAAAQTRLAERDTVRVQMKDHLREIGDLERRQAEGERKLAAARAAVDDAAKLTAVQDRLREVTEQLGSLKPKRERLAQLEQEGKRLRAQHDKLALDEKRCAELRTQAAALERRMEDPESLTVQLREVDHHRARVVATIEYQDVARTALEQGHCPLLEVECPVVAASPRTLERFSQRVAAVSDALRELDDRRAELDGRVAAARKVGTELQALQVQIARLESGKEELPRIAESLETCRAQYQELAREVESGTELVRSQREVQAEITRLEAAAKLAATLQLLEDQQVRELERLQGSRQTLQDLAGRDAELEAMEREAHELQAALRALDDPRGRQTALLATAGRRSELEATLRAEQDRLSRESDRLKVLVADLQPYATLDQEIESRRQIEEKYGADWERYLQHATEAADVPKHETAVTETLARLDEARSAEREAREQLEAVEKTYDQDRHAELSALSRELGERMAAAGTTHEHLEVEMRRTEEDLAYLRRKAEQLMKSRQELAEVEATMQAVGFVRETIKSAGPAVTESLLSNISQMANDIYAEIMDDHASELRWDRDYEILVQRGAETRSFAQLSGGEQMSAALAVRLALLKEMSEVDVAFFDEPTQNMDAERRGNLAGQIGHIRGFEQLIVISHDDTFEHHTDNLIRLRKEYDETQMETA